MKWNLPAVLAVILSAASAWAQPSIFTYQGHLNSNSNAANGLYELRFTLHDALSGGGQIGISLTNTAVNVNNGLFTTSLDFGAGVFNGLPRWLQVGVRPNGNTNDFSILLPRQPLTATPYATRAASAATATGLTSPLPASSLSGIIQVSNLPPTVALLNSNAAFSGTVSASIFLGQLPASNLFGTVADARLSSNVALLNTNAFFQASIYATNFSGNGVGLTNVPGRIFEVIPVSANVQSWPNFGYLATNDTAAVVVTLPASASMRVGETIRVAASGAGGWVVAQNAGQTIMMGTILDVVGQNWNSRAVSASWKGIASSADGKKLVATANPGGIYTSTDYGLTWGPRASSPAAQCVASSADGVKLVAGVSGGQIYTSINSGLGWTPHNPVASWSAVASSLDGVKLVATASGVSGAVYTSTDSGTTWPQRLGPGNFSSVASSQDGTRLFATLQGGLIYTSTDSGGLWVPRDSNRSWTSVACSSDGSRALAAVNGGSLYLSTDYGTNWAPVASSLNWTAVASSADGSKFMAANNTGGLQISSDSGLTWLARTFSVSPAWTGVAMSSDASTLAVLGSSTLIYVSSQAQTTTGTTGGLVGSRLSAVELEYVGGGVFMPVSYVGIIRAK